MPDATPAHIRRISWPLLALSLLGVAALTLLPIGWQLNRFVVWLYYSGLQLWRFPVLRHISMETLADLLNVALMVPIGLASALALPKNRWWHIGLGTLILSSSVEAMQAILPLGREASVIDVLTNTAGGVIGARLPALTSRRGPGPSSQLPARHESPPRTH